MQIGCHVSIAGGIDQSIDRAVERGADCLQSFASSPRSLSFQSHPVDSITSYIEKKKSSGMGSHFFHAPYLINLAHEKQNYVDACINALILHQQLAEKLNAEGTILHIGSHKGAGFKKVKKQVIHAIVQILEQTKLPLKLFIENAAGHKGVIGDNFGELGEIIRTIPVALKERTAVCLDTQHAFASGYDVRTSDGIDEMLTNFDKAIGLKYLQVIHANDSKIEVGGQRDRHENIGDGYIGKEGFRNILHHSMLMALPFLLEVPGKDHKGPSKVDVEILRSLA